MAYEATCTQKCCLTCANWSGSRTVSTDGKKATASDRNAKCFLNPSRGGFAYGPSYEWCCGSDYTKWAGLK